MSERKPTTLKAGALAFVHSHAGFMPCKVLRVYRDVTPLGRATVLCDVRMTTDSSRFYHAPNHRKGEEQTWNADLVVPRGCVYVRRGTFGRIERRLYAIKLDK
jgi:hypothetical protein